MTAAEEAKVGITHAYENFPLSLLHALEHIALEKNQCVVVPMAWKLEEDKLFASRPPGKVEPLKH